MTPTIRGNRGPIRTSSNTSYDPKSGLTVRQEYESAGDGLGGLANRFLQRGIPFEWHRNERKSKLSVTSQSPIGGLPEITADSWQLVANELQKGVREHPRVLGLPESGPGSLTNVEAKVKAHQNGEPTGTALTDDSLLLFNLLIHDVTHYALGQYVLRHGTNVSDAYDANVADFGVEAIYTTSQLISEISNTGYWTKPCPGRLVNKISNMSVQIPSNSDVMWGWRKLPSQETSAANNRIDISTEYWLGAWSRFLYNPL